MPFRPEINSTIIGWARERAGVPVDYLNDRFQRYGEWEGGEINPTMRQLEQLAKKLSVPLGYFFLGEPPEEPLPVPDYRTKKSGRVQRPSPELIDTLMAMERRQEWMRSYLQDQGAEPLAFIGACSTEDPVVETANEMRRALDLKSDWATEYSNWEQALTAFRHRLEEKGVLIVINGVVGNNTHRSLNPNEFRGFVLNDDFAPLVFVNGKDAKSAQMFTLAHEFAHLLIGQEGIFDLENLQPGEEETELFCDSVAAEFLAPRQLVIEKWNAAPYRGAQRFQMLARQLKVSRLVVARRALDLKLIRREQFFGFYASYQEEYEAEKRKEKEKSEQRGSFYNTQNTRVGKRFASAVCRAVREGDLLHKEAYELTGLRGETLEKYAERIGQNL